jgi:DNA cross-link repair 1A protein
MAGIIGIAVFRITIPHTTLQFYFCCEIINAFLSGKERIFMSIAERLGCRIWTNSKKSKILTELGDSKLSQLLTSDAKEAVVHVVPMAEISLNVSQCYECSKQQVINGLVSFSH